MSQPFPTKLLDQLPDPIQTFEHSIARLTGLVQRGELRADEAEHTLKLLTREVEYLRSQKA